MKCGSIRRRMRREGEKKVMVEWEEVWQEKREEVRGAESGWESVDGGEGANLGEDRGRDREKLGTQDGGGADP